MSNDKFLVDLSLALAAALVGGLLARMVRLPLLVGYLAAGIVVGPHTPGFTLDEHSVHQVARLGVAMLMFAVGTHLSLRDLGAARRVALQGGGTQILATVLLGVPLGMAMGWGVYGGFFLGCALALSSTAVVMHLLEERGELGTNHGTAMMGILVLQDLAVVVMVALLPAASELSAHGSRALVGVAASLGTAAVAVTITLVLASWAVPRLLYEVTLTGSRELFLLVVVCVCLAAGYLAQRIGLSLELGAFLAGVIISESDYAHEVFHRVRPLRDLFASLFFVSVGMLLDPGVLERQWPAVLAVSAAILIGKGVLTAASVLLAGAHGRTAVLAGFCLAQIGEFSFVLTSIGDRRGLIAPELGAVVLASALVTILLTPLAFALGPRAYQVLIAQGGLARLLNRCPPGETTAPAESIAPYRVLLLGCGRVGRYVSEALRAGGVPHLAVDYDAVAVQRMRDAGVRVLFGDATSEEVLKLARPERAELIVVALPEAAVTVMAVRTLKKLAPEVPVVARVHRGADIPEVRKAGADTVVHAEFEAGAEMIRQGLERLNFPLADVEQYLHRLRLRRYRVQEEADLQGTP